MMTPPTAARREAGRGGIFLRVWCRTRCFSATAADVRAAEGRYNSDACLVGAMAGPRFLAEQTLVRPGAMQGTYPVIVIKKRTGFSALLNKSGQGADGGGRGAIKKLEEG